MSRFANILVLLLAGAFFAYVHSNVTVKMLLDQHQLGKPIVLMDVGWLHSAATLAVAGKSPYDPANIAALPRDTGLPDVLVYPPVMLAPLLPLGGLSLGQATIVIAALNFLALVGIFYLLTTRFVLRLPHPAMQVLALAILFGFASLAQSYKSGNPLLLAVALLLVGWCRAEEGDRGFLTGLVLGLATLLKPHFAFLFLAPLLAREWRCLAGGAVSLVAALLAVHAVLPLDVWAQYLARVGGAAFSVEAGFSYASIGKAWNQSIPGVLAKLAGQATAPKLAGYLACLAVLGTSAIAIGRARRDEATYWGLSFSVALLAAFLVMPVSWVSYFAFLVIPALWLWRYLATLPALRQAALAVVIGLTAALALPFPHILSVYQTPWVYAWPVLLPLALWAIAIWLAMAGPRPAGAADAAGRSGT